MYVILSLTVGSVIVSENWWMAPFGLLSLFIATKSFGEWTLERCEERCRCCTCNKNRGVSVPVRIPVADNEGASQKENWIVASTAEIV